MNCPDCGSTVEQTPTGRCDICKSPDHDAMNHVGLREEMNQRLLQALHDAIARPKGVVPDSALEFYDPALTDDNKTV